MNRPGTRTRQAAAPASNDVTRAERESAWAELLFFNPALQHSGGDVDLPEESEAHCGEWLLCDFEVRPGRR